MCTFHRVCSAAELHSKGQLGAEVGNQKLALFKVGEDFVATNGLCPHANGPLEEGELDGTTISCPWHGWTFDLKTGVSPIDPDLKVACYPVRVSGGEIVVELP